MAVYKKSTYQSPRDVTGLSTEFDDYDPDLDVSPGHYEAKILLAKEGKSKSGNPKVMVMWGYRCPKGLGKVFQNLPIPSGWLDDLLTSVGIDVDQLNGKDVRFGKVLRAQEAVIEIELDEWNGRITPRVKTTYPISRSAQLVGRATEADSDNPFG